MKWISWKRKVTQAFFAICAIGVSVSCHEEYNFDNKDLATAERTFLFYMPWAGDAIYSAFLENIAHLESAIAGHRGGISGKRVLVFISQSDRMAHLFEIKWRDGQCLRDTLKKYAAPTLNSQEGISNILREMGAAAPAKEYAMVIGSHGMGWLPVGTKIPQSTLAKASCSGKPNKVPRTRYFGHQTDTRFQADIETLAKAIGQANLHMSFMMFDDCYMANVETAYELRNVTDYLIASTCEIFMEGMPYRQIGIHLLRADFEGICSGFLNYYKSYNPPCGTLSVTDCKEMEKLASLMKLINGKFTLNDDERNNIQVLDGLTTPLFFDFGHYVSLLCKDTEMLKQFDEQLAKTVIRKVNTPTFYSDHNEKHIALNTYSGLTISAPSLNPAATENIEKTSWYRATH